MKRTGVKADLQHTLGKLLTNGEDGELSRRLDFGNFHCSVETFDHFTIVKRNFETAGDSLHIPFSSHDSCVQMIFSLDGWSFFNKVADPFRLAPASHCLNFFHRYDCTNLLDDHARQHDITFRLSKGFYSDLIAQHLSSAEDHLPEMIVQEKEFNTINQHIPVDDAVTGILRNILDCPFQGEMKRAFIREHLRALFTLQLFHFNSIVTGEPAAVETTISTVDHEKLHGVKEYIDRHFLNPASLESLSRDFGLNEFKLKQGFKTLFDTSPIRYLQHKRLSFALTMLRDTDKSIKEIAHEIGYNHAANFTNAFVKVFGNPPQYFR